MKTGKIRSVSIGARGTGTDSNCVMFRVGESPWIDGMGTDWKVTEIEEWYDEEGSFGCNVFKKKDGKNILKFRAINQPLTIEYDDPEE